VAASLFGASCTMDSLDYIHVAHTLLTAAAELEARAKDEEFRREAVRLYNEIQRILKSGVAQYVQVTVDQGARLPLMKLTDDPVLKKLTLVAHEGEETFFRPKDTSIVVADVSSIFEQTYNVKLKALDVLKDKAVRSSFIHELVHYLDSERFSMEDAIKSYPTNDEKKEKGIKTYVNHPIETNAYFHQAVVEYLDKIEFDKTVADIEHDTGPDKAGSDKHDWAVWKLLDLKDQSFKNFLSNWRGHYKFWHVLSPENQKKLSARLYPVYAKVVSTAKDIIAELRKRKDPMLVEMDESKRQSEES